MATQDELNAWGEERSNLYQTINEQKSRLDAMVFMRTNDGLDVASLEAAHKIDDLFVQKHESVAQRTARVQIVVRETMRKMLTGDMHWATSTMMQSGNPHYGMAASERK